MNKRLLSIILMVAMLVSFIPSLGLNAYAEDSEGQIRVRIEGKNKTLYDEEITVTDEVYGIDLLETAIGEDNIDGTEGPYGLFINGLLGESAGESGEGYSTSWGLYIEKDGELQSAPLGISSLKIDGIDELLYHVKATTPTWSDLTFIPKLEAIEKDGQVEFTVTKIVTTYDENWNPIESEEVVEGAKIKINDEEYTTDDNGQVEVLLEEGIYDVKVYKEGENYPELIRRTFKIKIDGPILQAIEDLRGYYLDKDEFTFRSAMAYNFTSDNLEEDLPIIQSKYKVIDEPSSASEYANNILGLIFAGKDPKNYEGKNYVKTLVDSQNDDGKFIIKDSDDYPTTIAFSILALDMAEGDYQIEKAVNALMDYQNDDGSFGPYKDVDTTAMSITALGNHKDIEGVQESIDLALQNIKNNQSDTGGFFAWGSENPYSAAAAIQGLIAVGEDPLSEEWTKNGKTMVHSLLSFKVGNYFIYTTDWGTDTEMITEQAFMALADLYREKSMYTAVEVDIDKSKFTEEQVEYDFTLTRTDSGSFEKGQEAKLEVNVENNSKDDKEVTYIVALYKLDGSNKELYTYTFMSKDIEAGESEDFAGGFLIPSTGSYEVKAMLWDSFDNKTPLAEPITVNVK